MNNNYANYADVIDNKHLKKLLPKEYRKFKEELSEVQDIFDPWEIIELEDDLPTEFIEAVQSLQEAFKKITGELTLQLMYHERTERSDDVDGFFFHVNDLYELTPAGKKFNKYIERQFYVTYG